MAVGPWQILILGLIVGVLAITVVVPIIGIVRARRRARTGERAPHAVTVAAGFLVVSLLLFAFYGIAAPTVVLSGAWLYFAHAAKRAVEQQRE